MSGNEYEGVFEKREIGLIQRWARKAKFRPHEIPDVIQDVALAVIQKPDGWTQAPSTQRRQLLWIITRNTLAKVARREERRLRRDEQKALMVDEAYCDESTLLRLDVAEVVAGLDERCQIVCEMLSRGLPKSKIAERLGCGWHTVDRLVHIIRQRMEEAEVDAWLE